MPSFKNDEYLDQFASNLKMLRKRANLTQKQLGIAINISEKSAERTIQTWEGKESLPSVLRLRLSPKL